MIVLFISHKYPPSIGGMEKQSYELIKGFSSKSAVHKIVYDQTREPLFMFFVRLKSRIKKVLFDHPEIEIIHLNDGLMAAFTRWLPRYTDIPVVATFHGLDIVFPSKIYQKRIFPQFKQLSGIIPVSSASRQELVDRGIDKDRILTINNGVDHAFAEPVLDVNYKKRLEDRIGCSLKDKKLLVTMGRPVKRKGFSWFIKNVMPSLPADVVLLIIGPLKEVPLVIKLLQKAIPRRFYTLLELFFGMASDTSELQILLKLPVFKNRVFHLGKLPFEDVKQTLSLGDLFVMPNVQVGGDAEGFGLVALESAIRGTPVLASKLEGIVDAIHDGKNGYLIKSGDKEEWIFKLYQLLNDLTALADFGKSASEYTIENFSWDKMTKAYYSYFEEIIACGQKSRESYHKKITTHKKQRYIRRKRV